MYALSVTTRWNAETKSALCVIGRRKMETELIQGEPVWYLAEGPRNLKEMWILPISDVHYGNPLFSKPHFLRMVKFIAETHKAFAILNGDLCESTIKTSKGEIYKQVGGGPQEQRDWIIDKLYPIRHKLLGMTTGNHEDRIWQDVGIDISKDIAKALGIPYRREGIMLKVMFGSNNQGHTNQRYSYWAYATHGYGGARTKPAKAVKIERVATWIHADFYIMSHDHVVNVAPDVYLLPDRRGYKDEETGFTTGKMNAHKKMLIKSNAYLKWGGYSEMGGFPPVDLDCPIIKLSGAGKHIVRVEV